MNPSAQRELSARILRLSDDLEVVDGAVVLPEAKHTLWAQELKNTPDHERTALADEIVALAIRVARAGEGTRPAVLALSDLAVLLTSEDVQDAKKLGGSGLRAAHVRATGVSVAKRAIDPSAPVPKNAVRAGPAARFQLVVPK